MALGAIAVLILRESMVRGVWFGLAAGAGCATVDLIYCGLAVALGASLAGAIAPALPALAAISGAVIIAIGAWQLRTAITTQAAPPDNGDVVAGSRLRVYLRFVGLTALNPATIVSFLALGAVVATVTTSAWGPVVFIGATFIASLLWQSTLAVIGAVIGAAVSARTTRVLGIVASCAIIALGVVAVVVALTRG